ncbi:hypothetical protein LCGC14_0829160 [marine sediment metagenome]|uniref:Uncharacterized protein n=1 Tax=marine sediment metagenome TaxID=412755 RepID=A0A0F9PGH9_9ZZZZ
MFFLVPLLGSIAGAAGGLAAGAGSLAVGAGTAALGTAGTIGSAALGAAGGLASGAWTLGGQTIGMATSLPGTAWNLGGQVIGTGVNAIKWLSDKQNIDKLKPAVELLGQGYSAFQSYEQSRAAQEASQAYGGQVVVPYPVTVPSAGTPARPGQFSTIVDVGMGGKAAPMTKQQTEEIIKYGAIATIAYFLLKGF